MIQLSRVAESDALSDVTILSWHLRRSNLNSFDSTNWIHCFHCHRLQRDVIKCSQKRLDNALGSRPQYYGRFGDSRLGLTRRQDTFISWAEQTTRHREWQPNRYSASGIVRTTQRHHVDDTVMALGCTYQDEFHTYTVTWHRQSFVIWHIFYQLFSPHEWIRSDWKLFFSSALTNWNSGAYNQH